MNIVIIGGGNMGLTFAKAFINSHVVTKEQLFILEKDPSRIEQLESEQIASIVSDPSIISKAELIILAVKPQNSQALFQEMSAFVEENQVFLSIMAGITIETIRKWLKAKKIIRAMPNLPSQIGMGMTAFTATKEVSRFELGAIQNLLSTTGKTLLVDQEKMIDAVTAISGSGPAYIYYFMDSMISAGVDMGFSTSEAELLTLQTFKGALSLFQQNSLRCNEWIKKVASRGGTTEAALQYFDDQNLKQNIKDGLASALDRALELGKSNTN